MLITLLCNCRFAVVLLALVAFASSVTAQDIEVTAVGRVEAVYLNTKISDPVYLVQLRAEEVALNGNSIRPRGLRLPEANETLFIICAPGADRLSSRLTIDDLPRAGTDIRARLISQEPGQWAPAGTQWFESVAPTATTAGRDPATSAGTNSPQIDLRGMECEAIVRNGRLAFVVKGVAAAGPAHDAGFQVGDIVVAVDGQPVNSVAALKDFAAKSAPLKLSVVDVNTGQLAQVDLAFQKPRAPTTSSPEKTPPAAEANSADRIAKSLGIEITEARIGLRKTAVAVSKVDPLGAAAEAGIEVGDVIMGVNDQPTANADELEAALPNEGGKTTLLVRNVRGGDDVPVEVTARPNSAVERSRDRQTDESPAPGSADALGLATELAFYKGEAAVRITGVERGSPAARTGLQSGWLVVAANGKPILHPDDLKEAEKNPAGRLRLRVADPHTGRESEVELNR